MALGGTCLSLRRLCLDYAAEHFGLPPICMLTTEQHRVAAAVLEARRSVFLTGNAGCGKTFTFQALIKQAIRIGRSTLCCAPTGVAACPLEGTTLHQLFGLTVDDGELRQRSNWLLKDALSTVDCLFVDEASMISEDLFLVMDRRLRALRNQPAMPFGGLQIVVCGDPFQLPPIADRARREPNSAAGGAATASSSQSPRACFESALFRTVFADQGQIYFLTKSIRQAGDDQFSALLNEVRFGRLSNASRLLLQSRIMPASQLAALRDTHTHLFCRRKPVLDHNLKCLKALTTHQCDWAAIDHVYNIANVTEARLLLSKATVFESCLSLKVGAPVLLRTNSDVRRHLVNGTRGVVVEIARVCELGLGQCPPERGCVLCSLPGWVPPPARYDLLPSRPMTQYHRLICTATFSVLPVVKFDGVAEPLVVMPHFHDVFDKSVRRPTRKRKAVPEVARKRLAVVNAFGGAKAVAANNIDDMIVDAVADGACGPGGIFEPLSVLSFTMYTAAGAAVVAISDTLVVSSSSSDSASSLSAATMCGHRKKIAMQCGRCARAGILLRSAAAPNQCIHGAALDEQCQPCHVNLMAWAASKQQDDTGGPPRQPVATRVQLPLTLAWALTIHQAQGMTLQRICLPDIARAFDTGQVYVALSRACSLDGVVLAGDYVSANSIRASRAALDFWNQYCPRAPTTANRAAHLSLIGQPRGAANRRLL